MINSLGGLDSSYPFSVEMGTEDEMNIPPKTLTLTNLFSSCVLLVLAVVS